MEIRQQDSNLTLRGEASAISCPVGILCTYGCNALVNCFPFQNFRAEIKPKGFGCNRCDVYLSFEEVMTMR
ncbi:hypothetical protein ES703_124348 [subsurface metagenome]